MAYYSIMNIKQKTSLKISLWLKCLFLSLTQYLRKVLSEKKDGDKIHGAEIDLAEGTDEVRSIQSG